MACFNPHPARRPDATIYTGYNMAVYQVSILIQPEGRMQRRVQLASVEVLIVSILIQPEGRMQPVLHLPYGFYLLFQSSSSQKAGCNLGQGGGWVLDLRPVSILIQPEGRMQRARRAVPAPCRPGFNPHPARRPDATAGGSVPRGCKAGCFNPHPARRPDATRTGQGVAHFWKSFQSSSSQKAGCNMTSQI